MSTKQSQTPIGRQRVAQLIRAAGLEAVHGRRKMRRTIRDEEGLAVPDLVDRYLTACGPDQLWVAQTTCVPTWAGFLYLAVVLDVWSRRIVGRLMAAPLRSHLVLAALNMAAWQRRPQGVIHQSDQGSQYTTIDFGERCENFGCGRRWARSASATTTRCARASWRDSEGGAVRQGA